MPSHTVAVALITYERKQLLRDALRSVQAQTRRPDLVFISDNSKQPDHEVVKEFPDLPIHYHFHDRRLAIDEHWLWCLTQPQTDLVALLEDDNLFRPRHLEVLAGALEKHPDAALAGSSTMVFQQLYAALPRDLYTPPWPCDWMSLTPTYLDRMSATAAYLFGVPFASSAMMARRNAFPKTGFVQSGLRISHDRWMWSQIAHNGGIVFCPETTMLYRDHDVQVVKNFNRSYHRQDTARCTRLVWDQIKKSGLNPVECVAQFAKPLSARARRWYSYLLFRSREYAIWQQVTPALRPEMTTSQAAFQAVQDIILGRIK